MTSESDADGDPTRVRDADGSAGDRRAEPPSGELAGPGPRQRPRPRGRRTEQGLRADATETTEHPTRTAVVSAVVDHEPGVLAEVSGLFSRRQFNIESLTVGPTADDDYARITLVVEESDPGIEQVKKQLEGLLSVREVSELDDAAVRREVALIEVECERPERIRTAVQAHDAAIVDATPEAVTVEVTGPSDRVDDAVETFAGFGLRELARTGTTALAGSGTATTEFPRRDRSADGTTDATADDATTDDSRA